MKMNPFETQHVVLNCGLCGACPTVEIAPDGVSIGEDENTVRLTHAQWNDLVARVRTGELGEVKA